MESWFENWFPFRLDVTQQAACLWIFSIAIMSLVKCGSQADDAYSSDETINHAFDFLVTFTKISFYKVQHSCCFKITWSIYSYEQRKTFWSQFIIASTNLKFTVNKFDEVLAILQSYPVMFSS